MTDKFRYHDRLIEIATNDVEFLKKKDRSYGASWKESGRSAWFMCRRMIDRLTNMMARPPVPSSGFNVTNVDATAETIEYLKNCYLSEDLLAKLDADASAMSDTTSEAPDGTVLAVVRDLRRYLLLAEAEIVQRTLDSKTYVVVGTGGGGGDSRFLDSDGKLIVEDSNRHASLAPWLVDADYRSRLWSSDSQRFLTFWEPRGTGRWRLKEFVSANAVPPKSIEHLYARITNTADRGQWEYVLLIEHCPPELRPSYRKIDVEVNDRELSKLPHWIQGMYLEVPGAEKWRVTDNNLAWTRWE